MRRLVRATGVALALFLSAFSPQASAQDVKLDNMVKSKYQVQTGGAASGRALSLSIISSSGTTSLTIGQNEGSLGTKYDDSTMTTPLIDSSLLVDCSKQDIAGADALPLQVAGGQKCIDRAAAAARGFAIAQDASKVEIVCLPGETRCQKPDLASAGLVRLIDEHQRTPVQITSVAGKSSGLLIPNLAQGSVDCSAATPKASKTGLTLPDSLKGILTLSAGFANCETSGLSLQQSSGVADLGVTLTQTLVNTQVGSTSVNSALDTVQQQLAPLPDAVKTPVNNTIDNVQRELSSAPVLTLALGPNVSSIVGATDGSLTSTSQSNAVVLKLLNGLATVEIASAKAAASVSGSDPTAPVPNAKADPALIRIRVLNIAVQNPQTEQPLLEYALDPRDLQKTLDAIPTVPGVIETTPDEVILFGGTPLETHISLAKASECKQVAACTVAGSTTRFDATATASAVRVTAFGRPTAASAESVGPLPTVDLRLAEAQAAAVRTATPTSDKYAAPLLARTGAAAGTTFVVGLGLLAVAVIVRRRFV